MRRLLVMFDVDSTLIDQEVVDLLAAQAGCEQEVSEITAAAMRGELDFTASLRARVALLAGLPATALDAAYAQATFTAGAPELINRLRSAGHLTALVSGGFSWFTEKFAATLGIDYGLANTLQITDQHLSGKLLGPIVDRAAKADFLRASAEQAGIALTDTVGVGDGANDIDLINTAGLGIAFCAKPALVEQAAVSIEQRDLRLVWDAITRWLDQP